MRSLAVGIRNVYRLDQAGNAHPPGESFRSPVNDSMTTASSLAHCELLLPKGMSGGNGHCLEWNVLDDPGESDGCRKIPRLLPRGLPGRGRRDDDSAYAGQLVTWSKSRLGLTLKTVSRPKDASGFVILPRRWVVERSLAWIMHARRHARDYERLIQHSESLITWAAITLMTRRITRRSSRRNGQPAPRELVRD